MWVPADGGEVSLIAPTGGRDAAHFSNEDPDRIYAYNPAEGLVSFRWDGTDVKQHLRVRGSLPPGVGNPHEQEWVQSTEKDAVIRVARSTGLPDIQARTRVGR